MARQLLTPSPSPPPSVPTPTLPAQINAATRKQHVTLNRLIVDRLPLALPPNSLQPALFGKGLAAFASIYYTFEDVWQGLVSLNDGVDNISLSGTHDVQVRRWLATLRPEGLARSKRLKDDVRQIAHLLDTRIDRKIPAQRQMLDRMQYSLQANPHLLIAYGWVMYMAIFSGGRWIRQQLSNAGAEFWTGEPDYVHAEKQNALLFDLPGFSFLSFDGDKDGEDIKTLFKARLVEAETLLTQQERQDVIFAAQRLFEDLVAFVGILDRAVWWQSVWQKVPLVLICVAGVVMVLSLYWLDNYGYL